MDCKQGKDIQANYMAATLFSSMSHHLIFHIPHLLHTGTGIRMRLPEACHQVRPCKDEGPVQLGLRLGTAEQIAEAHDMAQQLPNAPLMRIPGG